MLKTFLFLFLICEIQCLTKPLEVDVTWKLIGYEIDGVKYLEDSDYEHQIGSISFNDEIEDNEKFFIKKNMVPYSIIYPTIFRKIFSVPRTRPGIPFTLNFVEHDILAEVSPLAQPYPNSKDSRDIISVYGLFQSACRRLIWFVDTGFIDIPGAKKQVKQPEIMAYSSFNNVFHRATIDTNMLQDGVTSGLRSVIVDHILPCDVSYVYVSDEYANTIIVYSLEDKKFHKINRVNTNGEAWSFPVPSSIVRFVTNVIKYRKTPKETFEHYSEVLRAENKANNVAIVDNTKVSSEIYPHGVLYQWTYASDILIFTNENRTGIYCWNMNTGVDNQNVETVLELTAEERDFYIASIEVLGLAFKLMLNKIRGPEPEVYDEKIKNFLYYEGFLNDILKDTKCVIPNQCTESLNELRESYQPLLSYKHIPKLVTEQYAEWFSWNFKTNITTPILKENC